MTGSLYVGAGTELRPFARAVKGLLLQPSLQPLPPFSPFFFPWRHPRFHVARLASVPCVVKNDFELTLRPLHTLPPPVLGLEADVSITMLDSFFFAGAFLTFKMVMSSVCAHEGGAGPVFCSLCGVQSWVPSSAG